MKDALNAIATTYIPFLSSVAWIVLSMTAAWKDDSVTLMAGWYAPLFHAAAWLALVALLVAPGPIREKVIEKSTANHAMAVIIEFIIILLYGIAVLVSQEAVLIYNGAFTLWMFFCLAGLIALFTGWEAQESKRNLPCADIRWIEGNHRYGLVHRVQIVDDDRDIGIVQHHPEVATDGYESGQVIYVGFVDSSGEHKTANAEVLSTEGVIRCRVFRSRINTQKV